jgi:ABC-type Fe3+ transport system permease subunit
VTTTVIAAADGDAALLTLGIALYAAVILVCVGVCVNALANHRKQLAIGTGATVIALSIAGVVVAILSSIA